MSGDPSADRRALVHKRWVHADGDDTDRGAVFRDAAGDLPLTRRPKEYLEFSDDGTVRRLATGPDDRAREVDRTRWRDEGGRIAFSFNGPDAGGRREYFVVDQDADRLVIERR